MLARINNTETLMRCLYTPSMKIISTCNDIFGTVYLRPSQEAGCVDVYDTDGEYIFFMGIDDAVEDDHLYAKFDHRSEFVGDYQWEREYSFMTEEERNQICLNEYLDLYEGVELCEDLDEDYDY